MSAKSRFAVGFGVGLAVGAPALTLAGAGHGTYAPLIAASSVLLFVPTIGIFLAVFGAPFLWAIYFAVIPGIEPPLKRMMVLVLILLLHFVPGVWTALDDPAFARQLEFHPGVMVVDGLMLCGAFILLALLGSNRKPPAEVNR